MEEVGRVQRGPKGSLKPFQRVWLSRNLIRELLQEICRGSTGCSRISTGCSIIFYRMFRKVDFRGWMEEKWWESENRGWIMMLRGLGHGT